MGNVTLPTPVFLAGGALCVVAGLLVGSVLGPETPQRITGTVVSFDTDRSTLCLEGDAVQDLDDADDEGRLCGTLNRGANSEVPAKGDDFRFVSVSTAGEIDGKTSQQVVIYGDVVD